MNQIFLLEFMAVETHFTPPEKINGTYYIGCFSGFGTRCPYVLTLENFN
jgi:hypothetical protein